MVAIGQGRELVGVLEKTARNVLIFGILLAAGLVMEIYMQNIFGRSAP
jgi:hypothetical protein